LRSFLASRLLAALLISAALYLIVDMDRGARRSERINSLLAGFRA